MTNTNKLFKPYSKQPLSLADKQAEILATQGAQLRDCRQFSKECPITKINIKSLLQEDSSKAGSQQSIAIRNNQNSNTQAMGLLLLGACFQGGEPRGGLFKIGDRNKEMLTKFKRYLYSEATLLEGFGRQYAHPKYDYILQNNRLMKKILAQILNSIASGQYSDLLQLYQAYPIVNLIMVCVVRSLVDSYFYSYERTKLQNPVSNELIVKSLRSQFGLKVQVLNQSEVLFEDQYVVKQQKNYVHIKSILQPSMDSENYRKTEDSEGNASSGVFKELADISAIEAQRSSFQQLESPVQNTIPSKRSPDIKSLRLDLNTIRRCDSIYTGGNISESAELISEGGSTNRSKKPFGHIREADSQIDQSCESNNSCVLYKVEFNKLSSQNSMNQEVPQASNPQQKRKVSPKRKQLSPRTIHQNRSTPVKPSNFKLELQPVAEESGPKNLFVTPNYQGNLKSRLSTIPAVEESCIEDSVINADGVDTQVVKNQLYEGTTSEAILNLLSNASKRKIAHQKSESMRSLMEKFSSTKSSYGKSMRSFNNSGNSNNTLQYHLGPLHKRTSVEANVSLTNFDKVMQKKVSNFSHENYRPKCFTDKSIQLSSMSKIVLNHYQSGDSNSNKRIDCSSGSQISSNRNVYSKQDTSSRGSSRYNLSSIWLQ